MSTQQDIYTAGSESRPPMLNKENYVPWLSHLLQYAKSRPNGKLIHNSILNGPYVRRMIPEPSDAERDVNVNETFYDQTDDELSERELKQIEADDQAIHTILLVLPEDIYAAVDSCETAQEIWLRVQQMMKGSDIGIHNSIINGPYVRRMIPEPGDPNREVPVNETFHVQTDDELTEKELKQIEANDQAIQTILPGLPEHIYATVDSCKTAQEIWLRVQQMMKGFDIEIQEKKANEINTFQKSLLKEVDELKAERLAKTQDPLELMASSNNPYTFPVPHQDQPSFNQNYMQQPMPNPKDITDLTTAMNMALALMAKEFKLNYSTPTNNNQRISSNPRNRHIAQPGMNMGQDKQMQMVGGNGENQFRQYAGQNVGNLNGYNDVQNVRNQRNGSFARNYTVRPRRRDAAYLQTQLLIAQKEEAGIQLQPEEFDLMAAAADLDEIEEVNANCILMANLQQASTSDFLTKIQRNLQALVITVRTDKGTDENWDKMKEKGDQCILVGYSTQTKGYRVYNKRTRMIVESIRIRFDEIKEVLEASIANNTSGLVPQRQDVSSSADEHVPSQQELDMLFGPLYDEILITEEGEHIPDDEFTNPFCASTPEVVESSSHNVGKENGENILQSIDEGPFKMGKFRETLAEGALHLGAERDRVAADLTLEEKERYKANIRATHTLLQGGQDINFDDDVDEPPVQDLEPNVENVFQANQCDAFDFDVDETYTMLMVDDNVRNQFRQNVVHNVGNLVGHIAIQNQGIQNVRNQNGLSDISGIANQYGIGNFVTAHAEGNGNGINGVDHYASNYIVKPRKWDAAYLHKQMHISQKEEVGIQLTSKEFDFMAAAGACEETKRANANCTLENKLQQASTSGT
nr:integrase, catalytic region, zinc finger, CCHC-type, peptidase aspartic, catalytic [Tanacetum cinerariifolium]